MDTAIRRAAAAAGAALLAAALLTACDTGVEGLNTPNGRQLRPSDVATPPAFPERPVVEER